MNHDDESDGATAHLDLLLDVLERRRSIDAPEVQRAIAQDPRFAAQLRGALQVHDQLAALRHAEQEAMAEPGSPLDAVAIAAARTGLALVGPPTALRRWPWLALAMAAGLVLGAWLWNGRTPDPIAPSPDPVHLAGELPIAFDEAIGALVLPELPAGHSYRVEFVSQGVVVERVPQLRETRLVLPSLRAYAAPVQVRIQLQQGGDSVGPRGEAAVPTGMLR